MAVKVIEKKVVCKNCDATLTYTHTDVLVFVVKDNKGVIYNLYWLRCPNCGQELTIEPWR